MTIEEIWKAIEEARLEWRTPTFYWDGLDATRALRIDKVEVKGDAVRIHWSLLRAGAVRKSSTGYFVEDWFVAEDGVSEYKNADPTKKSWWEDAYDEEFKVKWWFSDVVLGGDMDIVSVTDE